MREALAPAGIGAAGVEQAPDAVTFKQLLAGGGLTHCQIDGARVGGVNWFGSEGRLEYLEFLQKRVFRHPLKIRNGRYVLPSAPGWGLEMEDAFVARYRYPEGADTANSEEADRVAAAQPGAPPYVRYWLCPSRDGAMRVIGMAGNTKQNEPDAPSEPIL